MRSEKIQEPPRSGNAVRVAETLISTLRSRSAETDRLATLPQATFDDLQNHDLWRLLYPRIYGGQQLDQRTGAEAIMNLAKGDMSVAWVANILNGCTALVATVMPDHVCDKVFSSPGGARVAGVFIPRSMKARPDKGGVLIEEGLWGFNSGVKVANWDLLGIPVFDESGAVVDEGCALLPTSEIEILDDWDTVGLRGTGSNTVRVRNVRVEPDWILPFGRWRRENFAADRVRNINSLRVSPAANGAITLTYPMVGAAEAALELFLERASKGGIQYTQYNKRSEAPVTHLIVGEASAKIDAAKLLVFHAIDLMSEAADAGVALNPMQVAQVRRDSGLVAMLLWEAVDLMATGSGGSFIGANNLASRFWKDVRAGTLHGAITPPTALEFYGRVACGMPSNMTMAGLRAAE